MFKNELGLPAASENKPESIDIPCSLPVMCRTGVSLKEKIGLIAAMVLPVALLCSFAAAKTSVVTHGQRISMLASLEDPRDFLRGDYLKLDFPQPPNLRGFSDKDDAFVVFAPNKDKIYTPVAAYRIYPRLEPNQVCIRGVAQLHRPGIGHVEYPFTQAFIAQGTGTDLRTRTLQVELSVASRGEAVLTKLTADGEVISKI